MELIQQLDIQRPLVHNGMHSLHVSAVEMAV